MDKLMSPDEAREFTLSMGIMQVEDAEVTSPNTTDKDKTKNLEENVSLLPALFLALFSSSPTLEKSERADQEVCGGEERTRKETATAAQADYREVRRARQIYDGHPTGEN